MLQKEPQNTRRNILLLRMPYKEKHGGEGPFCRWAACPAMVSLSTRSVHDVEVVLCLVSDRFASRQAFVNQVLVVAVYLAAGEACTPDGRVDW